MGMLTGASVASPRARRMGVTHHMVHANHGLLQSSGQSFHSIRAYAEASRHAGSSGECDAIYVLDTYTSLLERS